jgi:DNA-binding NarL/FixJ family response regulator
MSLALRDPRTYPSHNMLSKPRVVIADRQALVAEAFEKLLASDCTIAGRVTDGRALIDMVREQRPDIAVVDVELPMLNGLDAGREARQIHSPLRIVIVTTREDPDLAASAFRAGASAFLLKRCAGAELLKAIQEVMRGRTYVTPLIADLVVQSMARPPEPGQASPRLTLRQREVLQLLAEGRSMKEAARILRIRVGTVAFHKYRLMEQLNVRTSADLIRFAVQRHVI